MCAIVRIPYFAAASRHADNCRLLTHWFIECLGDPRRWKCRSRNLAAMIRRVIGQMLHQLCQTELCRANRKHLPQGFLCQGTYELRLFFLYFLHFKRTAARLGNATGWNRASCRSHKSARNAALWDDAFQ